MRFALGTTALASLSAMLAAIVTPSSAAPATVVARTDSGGTSVSVARPVVYVQLKPGETAPPGARVIDAAAPKPVTVVTVVPAPSRRPVIIRTTQSGKVLP